MQVDRDVLNILSRCAVQGSSVVIHDQLERKLYERTNKVLEAAGGKWNRSAKAHLFDGDAGDRIEQIILTESVIVPKDEFDFFPTPPQVVHAIVDAADCGAGMRVLEPSAGRGNIAKAFQPFAFVDCVEVLDANCSVLATHGYRCVHRADFLAIEPEQHYDRVVMNPPFSKRRDMTHVQHAYKFLKRGGRLVAIMPIGFTFREDRAATNFRHWIKERGAAVDALPAGSFKESGTMVNTVLVTIDKPC